MRAIVIGGTGATGTKLVDELLRDDDITEVVSLVRDSERVPNPKLKEIEIDFDNMQSYAEHIYGDIAFSCLGTTVKAAGGRFKQWKVDYEYNLEFAKIAKSNDVPTFVLQSALNADSNGQLFYSKMKGKLEDAIMKLGFDHFAIVRPSILKRPDSDRKGEQMGVEIMEFINSFGFLKGFQPLHVNQVATAMLKAGKTIRTRIDFYEVKEILSLNR